MIIKKESPQLFVLENKFFDQLTNTNDIALYAFFIRIEGVAYTDRLFMEALNLSKKSLDKSIKKLLEIGFLELNKEI